MPPDDWRRAGSASRAYPPGRRRRGNSLLEVQVAFAVLGVGLAGMCQLAVVQLRQVWVLESRLQGQVGRYDWSTGTYATMQNLQYDASNGTYSITPMVPTYYLVPWQNPWTRKLTGSAQIVNGSTSIPCDPNALPVPTTNPPQAYPVNVVTPVAMPTSQSVTAYVDVTQH